MVDRKTSAVLGSALTKTFLHNPFVFFEPLSKNTSGKNKEKHKL